MTVQKGTRERGREQMRLATMHQSMRTLLSTHCTCDFGQRFSSNPSLPFEKIKQWKEFKADVDAILSAFEKFALKTDPGTTGGLSAASSAAYLSTTTVYNPKFLTSSRLLRLQLQDPELRRNVLCQILIICDRMLSPEAKMPDAYRTSKAIAATAALEDICSRALNLLRSTKPDGPAFTRGVQHVLERERVWVQWKEARCEGYERFSELSQDETADLNKAETRKIMVAIAKAKRKAVAGGDGSVARSKKARENPDRRQEWYACLRPARQIRT